MKELLSLPHTELERRCRHNGLSIVGGKATIVAQFLYLENAEKQRGHELDEDLKFVSHSSSARFPSTQKDSNLELDRMAPSKRNSQVASDVQLKQRESVSSPLTNSAPHYKSIDFSSEGKNETILPTSKWAREDDEQKRSSRDLGLTYSFSGSENAGDGLSKIKDAELTTDTSNSVYPESGMTEELRQKLRRLEVALIEYHESLEERGIKSSDEIESKVEIHRQRLQSEYGLLNFSGDISTKGGRSSVERREKRDYSREASRKRRSRSGSPPWKSSSRDHDSDREKRCEMERKSVGRERDDQDRDKSRERRRAR
ncbi:hypothetical protein AABB24_034295 [Solanum stoloniferum]|uniref:CWF21 domain-containing protein n=1 Tax=Solanum stoloniferum TaxID=62892 RepID=A0ABD2REZ4_9SOLN